MNKLPEAGPVRDELNAKQAQIRVVQLQNQARLEVDNGLIAMRRARSSCDAAVQERKFQRNLA